MATITQMQLDQALIELIRNADAVGVKNFSPSFHGGNSTHKVHNRLIYNGRDLLAHHGGFTKTDAYKAIKLLSEGLRLAAE